MKDLKIFNFYIKLIDNSRETKQEKYWVTWFDTRSKSFKALTWKYCSTQNAKWFLVHYQIVNFSNIAIAISDFSLLLLFALVISSLLLFFIDLFIVRFYCYCNSWKSNNYMGRKKEKKLWTYIQSGYKKWSKEVNDDNFMGSKREVQYCFSILEKLTFW